MTPETKAEAYRRRADELRRSVADMQELAARDVMLRVADRYDRVAVNLEAFLAGNRDSHSVYLL